MNTTEQAKYIEELQTAQKAGKVVQFACHLVLQATAWRNCRIPNRRRRFMTPTPRTDALAKEYAGVTSCNPNALLTEVQNMELKVAQLERELAEKARLVEVERGIAEANSGARGEIEQLQQRVKELEAKCVEMRKLLVEALTDAICLFAKRLFDKSDA